MSAAHDWSDDDILTGISAALTAGDMPAAAGLLRLLALQAPAKAQVIYDAVVHRRLTIEIPLALIGADDA